MHNHVALIVVLLILTFGLFFNLSERSAVSGPMFFVGIGLLVGALGFNVIEVYLNTEVVKILTELTLIIILFVDASLIHFSKLGTILAGIPARLLPLCAYMN